MSRVETGELVTLFERLSGDAQVEVMEDIRHRLASEPPGEVLSLEEIAARYPERWVVLDLPQYEHGSHLLGGRVRCVGDEKAAMYREAKSLDLKHSAILFMGDLDPKGDICTWIGPSIPSSASS